MFKKLKKQYFGTRLVEGIVEIPSKSRVVVTYADDKKPKQEEMHLSEWEDGKSDKPMERPDQKQEWFVNRTQKMRQAVLDTVISYNPRFTDMKKVIAWIDEGINMTYRSVVSKVFGLENFDTDATVELVASRLEKSKVLTEEWTDFEKEVFALMRKTGVKVHEIVNQSLLGSLQQKVEGVISESVAEALGGSDEARRCDDIEKLIKEHSPKVA